MVTTEQIRDWVQEGKEPLFYWSRDWKNKRREVLAVDKGECVACKAKGKYTQAQVVHHVKHLRSHPALALSIWYIDGLGEKQRQLVSLCVSCHELQHPERMRQHIQKKPLTQERW